MDEWTALQSVQIAILETPMSGFGVVTALVGTYFVLDAA